MLSAPTLSRLASLAAFLNTAPGLRGGQPADERFTAATQLPSLVPELQEDEVRLRLAAAAAVRFPPLGSRGVGATSRAGEWGALPLAEYLRFGQQEVVLIAQVESALGVANAAAIAAVSPAVAGW